MYNNRTLFWLQQKIIFKILLKLFEKYLQIIIFINTFALQT